MDGQQKTNFDRDAIGSTKQDPRLVSDTSGKYVRAHFREDDCLAEKYG